MSLNRKLPTNPKWESKKDNNHHSNGTLEKVHSQRLEQLIQENQELKQLIQEQNARLERIAYNVADMAGGKFHIQLPISEQGDEIDALCFVINETLEEFNQYYRSHIDELNAELSQLIYRASHNLRAPLCSMEGLLSLLDYQDPDGPQMDQFKSIISEGYAISDNLTKCSFAINYKAKFSNFHLSECIDSLKEFSKGKLQLQFTSFDQKLFSDKEGIIYIIERLLDNAITHAYPDQNDGVVHVSAKEKLGNIIITVADFGPGIDQKIQPQVFNMFVKGCNSTESTGLGLYGARRVAKTIGAKLTLDTSNLGATFRLIIQPKNN